MALEQQAIEAHTDYLVNAFGKDYPWRWDERTHTRLSEFASNKKVNIMEQLESLFVHQWDKKTVKFAPKELKQQLGVLATLNKEQKLFTIPATDNSPTVLAIWWPWGHGSTISLRLTVLEHGYQLDANEQAKKQAGILSKLKKLFNLSSR